MPPAGIVSGQGSGVTGTEKREVSPWTLSSSVISTLFKFLSFAVKVIVKVRSWFGGGLAIWFLSAVLVRVKNSFSPGG